MKELKQMFWMVLGVLLGFAVGALLLILVIKSAPGITKTPAAILVAVPLLGGGLAGGGYLAQRLVEKYERAKKRRVRESKEQDPFSRKRRKK